MEILGRVQNGVIVLDGEPPLPEGMVVTVSCKTDPVRGSNGPQRIEFPLVHSLRPGSLKLTAERIAEILDEEDVSA
jgi:hypothetical protein